MQRLPAAGSSAGAGPPTSLAPKPLHVTGQAASARWQLTLPLPGRASRPQRHTTPRATQHDQVYVPDHGGPGRPGSSQAADKARWQVHGMCQRCSSAGISTKYAKKVASRLQRVRPVREALQAAVHKQECSCLEAALQDARSLRRCVPGVSAWAPGSLGCWRLGMAV